MSRFVRGVSVTLTTRVVALLIGVASSVVVARALGPAGKGEYALIVLIPALFQLAGGFGLDQAMVYLVARRRSEARAIATTIAAAAAGLGALLIAVYAAVSAFPPYSAYLQSVDVEPQLVWVLVALIPVTLASLSFTSAILALERYREYNLATVAVPAVNLALLLALVVTLHLGVAGAIAALGSASVIGLGCAAGLFFTVAPAGRIGWCPGIVRQALSFGSRAQVGNLAWFVHYRADMFLVGYFGGPVALGFYAAAVGLAEKLYLAPSAIGTVLFPRVAASDRTETRHITPRASRHTLWLTLFLSVILAALARPVVQILYGAEFLPSVPALWLLLPGVVSLAVGRVVSADLTGRGLPGVVARANVAMAVLNIALNLWWIPVWGVAGAAAATSISYTAAVLTLARRYRRASGAGWGELLVLRASDWTDFSRALASLFHGERAGPAMPEEPRL